MAATVSLRGLRRVLAPVWLLAILSLALAPVASLSNPNPDTAEIRHGEIEFDAVGDNLDIIQHSSHAIIEWDGFSIASGERTNFIQPGDTAIALNRALGGRSDINGILEANGRVILVNPNGVMVGPSGSIDAAGFIASTLDISDGDFLAGGDLNFSGGSAAAIVNLGTIRASSGDAILVAAQVQNAGQLLAPEGLAGIAAGTDVLLKESGEERLFVRAGAGSIQNDPTGNIEGRVAELKAGGNVYGLAIQQHGRVAATGAVNEGGQIFLRANGGKIVNSTPVAAKKITIDGGDGGEVELPETASLTANEVELTTNGGKITQLGSVTGVTEGAVPGSVTIDAGEQGDVELGPMSRTAGELVTVSSLGGDITSAGQLLGTAGATDGSVTIDAGLGGAVNLTMDSETSAGAVTVRATGGSILAAGHVVGNDGGSVNFEANDGGEIVVPLGGLIEGGDVRMSASKGSIDHAGTVIAETLDGQGGRVSMDVSPGGAITIQPTGIIRGGEIELLANDGGKIEHAGQIIAEDGPGGGTVTMQADGGEVTILPTGYIEGGTVNVLAEGGTITHQGVIKARDGDGNGGTVTMDAGAGGSVEVFGVIDASGSDGVGGTVTVTGDEVAIRAGALIDASGTAGGGTINIGGGFGGNDPNIHNAKNTTVEAGAVLRADATVDGPGGNVVVWADGTTNFAGTISARGAGSGIGGNAEVSGKNTLNFGGEVDLGSESGIGGNLLLDPGDFTIDGSNVGTITGALSGGSNVTVTTNAAAAGNGDVFVNTPVLVNSMNQGVFSILAHRHIRVNERIQLSGDGGAVNLIAGWDGSTGYSPVPPPGIATPVGVPDMTQFPENENSFGNGMGSVFVGGDTVLFEPVWVGSRNGPTAVLGYNLEIASNPAYHTGLGIVDGSATSAMGDISVDVINNVSLTAANSADGRARIGHELSGVGATIDGQIFVNARRGGISISSAADPMAVAAIGHYAPNGSVMESTGGMSGPDGVNIRAHGDVSIVSGGADAFIGNYADQNSASISVEGDNIALDATNGRAFIGHTDGGTIMTPLPSASGNLSIFAKGQLNLTDGAMPANAWRIGHENLEMGVNSPIAIAMGSLGPGGAVVISQEVADRLILPNIQGGPITLASIGAPAGPTGGLQQNATINFNSPNDLNLLSFGDLTITGGVNNASTIDGGFNAVAGWMMDAGFSAAGEGGGGSGSSGPGDFDPTQLANDPTGFGRGGATLNVDGAISTHGANINLFGGNVVLNQPVTPPMDEGPTANIHVRGEARFNGAHVESAKVFGHGQNDTIFGPNEDINWLIDADGSGSFAGVGSTGVFPQVDFEGIENLNGGMLTDSFIFTNGASLTGTVNAGGGYGMDELLIDFSHSSDDHFFAITGNRVRVNPTYDFEGIETLGVVGGSGDDNISTQFFNFQQNLDGGGGSNRLGVLIPAGFPSPGFISPLNPPDNRRDLGRIFFMNMDALILSRAAAGEVVATKVVDRPAVLNQGGDRGADGIRVRDIVDVANSDGMLLAEIDPILQQQSNAAQNQLAAEVQSQENNNPAGENGIANQNPQNLAPRNNTPPGESQDIGGDSGPVEMDGGGSRPSANLPQQVQNTFDNMFNPGDWGGTGLNIVD